MLALVKKQDRAALARALKSHRGPIPAAAVVSAAGLGWKAGLELLVEHGADLNASYRNYRPIHALIQEDPHRGGSSTPKRLSCLTWLLKHGADPELTAAWPAARALVVAAFVGEPAYVKVLRDAGAEIDIFTASALGEARRVEKLLAGDRALAEARDNGLLTALQCAGGSRMGASDKKIAAGLLHIAAVLVDAGADVNLYTRSYAHDVNVAYFVIRAGQIEMLRFLLSRGLDATAAVGTAAWDAREDILDVLVQHGAQVDQAFDRARPVLNELVRWGQLKQARMLLSRGANPNIPDDRGWTAIHQAASRGNVKILEDLIAAGGDLTRRDNSGHTPLDIARAKPIARLIKAMRQ
jgi:ankyrin repeat protein